MSILSNLDIGGIMRKVTGAVAVVAAGVAVLNATTLDGAAKKKTLMTAMNALEGEFKIDLPDNVVSIVIELVLIVGKSLGALPSAPSQSSLPPASPK